MSELPDAREIVSRFKTGINKGLRIVNIRSKEAYDTLRIKNTIRQLRNNRRNTVYEMGHSIYRTYKHKGEINGENIEAKCADIENIETEIEEWGGRN